MNTLNPVASEGAPAPRRLQPDERFFACEPDTVWRVQSGLLRIDTVAPDGDASAQFTRLALPGDLIGLEQLLGLDGGLPPRALTPARLQPLAVQPAGLCALLSEALQQSTARCREVVALRSGSVPERIKLLLLMLARANPGGANDQHALPTLKDMATIVASAPETVSRVIGGLRQLHLLHDRIPHSARFNSGELEGHLLQPGLTSSSRQMRQQLAMVGPQ